MINPIKADLNKKDTSKYLGRIGYESKSETDLRRTDLTPRSLVAGKSEENYRKPIGEEINSLPSLSAELLSPPQENLKIKI